MNLLLIETLGTVAAMAAFVAVVIWAYSGRRTRDFEQASRLPFAGDNSERVND
jgi:cytochrome c oxidase cbb3-type subunit 4